MSRAVDPSFLLLELEEDVVEALAQVGEDMIVVIGDAMPGMGGRGGAADEHSVREQPLGAGCCGQNIVPGRPLHRSHGMK